MVDQQGGLPERTSQDALQETASLSEKVIQTIKQRPLVQGITLDHPFSKDLDDAFWIEQDERQGHRLLVSIADVASFVRRDLTPTLVQEAYERTATIYADGDVLLSMLPQSLSEDLLSLREGQPRATITLSFLLDAHFSPNVPQIMLTRLNNVRRLSYAEADEVIASSSSELATMLRLAHGIAQALFARRRLKGALALYDLPSGWMTTEEGNLRTLRPEEQYTSHLIPNEFMILTNQALANLFAQHSLPALYRNHQARLTAPTQSVLLHNLELAVAHPERLTPEQVRVSTDLVMERAMYSPSIAGHFSLNLPVYLHLTSPLRRAADLLNQQVLVDFLASQPFPYTKGELEEKAAYLNKVEQERKAALKEHFLAAFDRDLRQALFEPGEEGLAAHLNQLETEPFHSLIRIAAQSSALFPELEQAILKRLTQRDLRANDLYTLVFRYPTSGEAWQRMKQAVIQSIGAWPEEASQLLRMGAQASLWSTPAYDESEEGSEQFRPFRASVRVFKEGQPVTSASHTASKKALARHLASHDLLIRLAGVEGELGELPQHLANEPSEVLEEEKLSLSVNAVGQLYELKDGLLIKDVQFNYPQIQDPSHQRTFLCHCTVATCDGRTLTGSGSGTTKKGAKQAAAMDVLMAWVLDGIEQREEGGEPRIDGQVSGWFS